MEEGVDLVTALAVGLRDRESAWGFIREFASGWLQPLRPEDGFDDVELSALHEGLQARHPEIGGLPRALLETFALLGHRRDLTSNQDSLLTDHRLWVDELGGVLVVRVENQGCAHWGIRLSDLDQDDPPTVVRIAGDPQGWAPHAPRWSVACLEMILFEALFSDSELTFNTALDNSTIAAIETTYPRLPMPDLPQWTVSHVRWYAGPDVLLRDEAQTWLWALARTPAALVSLQETLTK